MPLDKLKSFLSVTFQLEITALDLLTLGAKECLKSRKVNSVDVSIILTGTAPGDVKQSKQNKTFSSMGVLKGLVSSLMQLQKDSCPLPAFSVHSDENPILTCSKNCIYSYLPSELSLTAFPSEFLSILSYFHLKL